MKQLALAFLFLTSFASADPLQDMVTCMMIFEDPDICASEVTSHPTIAQNTVYQAQSQLNDANALAQFALATGDLVLYATALDRIEAAKRALALAMVASSTRPSPNSGRSIVLINGIPYAPTGPQPAQPVGNTNNAYNNSSNSALAGVDLLSLAALVSWLGL